MPRFLIQSMVIVFLLWAMVQCVSTRPSARLPITENYGEPKGPLYQMAETFDKLTNGQLKEEEIQSLTQTCESGSQKNPFCFSILNFSKFSPPRAPKTQEPKIAKTIRVSVQNSKIVNWKDLREAPIARLLKGLETTTDEIILLLKKQSLTETDCPNNPAIAVAVTLEDWLPHQAALADIARLYEKASTCANISPLDRENLLTRAGLFYFADKKFVEAEKVFMASVEMEEVQPRTLYWLYRTHLMQKNKESAQVIRERLKTRFPFSFHSLLALSERKEDPGVVLSRIDPIEMKRSVTQPDVNRLLEQAEILGHFGFFKSATKVLDWTMVFYPNFEPELKIYVAELLNSVGGYPSKISVLSDLLYKNPELVSRKTLELYFPKTYFEVFEKYALGIDPYLLTAIARRESAFNPRAQSKARAKGLLQVMGKTGRRFASQGDLFDPEHNVKIGARYFNDLMQKANGRVPLALAAYNAGPNRVEEWLRRYPLLAEEPVLFIDMIPFRETRNYVAGVLRNYFWYLRIHKNETSKTVLDLLQISVQVPAPG